MFKVSNLGQHDTMKTLIAANQSRFQIKKCFSVIFFSSIETKSRYFKISFVLADINYVNPGTPFFEVQNQIEKIQDFSLNFRQYFNDQPTIVSFTTLIEKNFPFF